ncbi:hypothetical protein [Nocardioides sambongensis]|uniref:hypothetical protein n=1 Tax=Nocardioides sambongensis TaxID=2589074 RepID=UPI00112A7E18|nr:hypothetical protein [Nocardioides sambongensis]
MAASSAWTRSTVRPVWVVGTVVTTASTPPASTSAVPIRIAAAPRRTPVVGVGAVGVAAWFSRVVIPLP